MTWKKKLNILSKGPFKLIKDGYLAQNQTYFKEQLEKSYGLSRLPSIDLADLMGNEEVQLDTYSYLVGTSIVPDLVLLQLLAKKAASCEYLEIGSWRGESLAAVSPAVKNCTSVTLSAEEMKAMNFGQKIIDLHDIFSKDLPNVRTIHANSHHFDFNSLGQKFDLIFVDGDHSYEGVLNDTKKIFDLRKDVKSVIVWHDYSYDTEDVRYPTLKAILDAIPKEKHQNLYHVSNTMCAVYIENCDYETQMISTPVTPTKTFTVKLKANRLS